MFDFSAFILTLGVGAFFGWIGMTIMDKKEQSPTVGFFLGFLLGVIGLLITILWPSSKSRFASQIEQSEKRTQPLWESDKRVYKKCPFCAETIMHEAAHCHFCRRDMPNKEFEWDNAALTASSGQAM